MIRIQWIPSSKPFPGTDSISTHVEVTNGRNLTFFFYRKENMGSRIIEFNSLFLFLFSPLLALDLHEEWGFIFQANRLPLCKHYFETSGCKQKFICLLLVVLLIWFDTTWGGGIIQQLSLLFAFCSLNWFVSIVFKECCLVLTNNFIQMCALFNQ